MRKTILALLVIALAAPSLLGQTAQTIASINRKVIGRWVSSDGKNYIQFLADSSCLVGNLASDGKWYVEHNTLGVWPQGDEFICGSGVLTLTGPNALTRDFGMGGEPEKYYRGDRSMTERVVPLTVAVAQRILNQQLNRTTVNNTLLTCHACYDAIDKGNNNKSPVVSTYSTTLSQYLIKQGYIRIDGDREVFTEKAKRSKYYAFNDGAPGLRFASFKNPHILTSKIVDTNHVPIGYDLAPTEITEGFFGKVQSISSFASFSYQNDRWEICIACRH